MKQRLDTLRRCTNESLSRFGLELFLVLNLSCALAYDNLERADWLSRFVGEFLTHTLFRLAPWVMSICFLCISLWWPNLTRFGRRIAALGSLWMGSLAILYGFYSIVQPVHLLEAQAAVAALTQIGSIILFVLEFRDWRARPRNREDEPQT